MTFHLNALGLLCALGNGVDEVRRQLFNATALPGTLGVRPCALYAPYAPLHPGQETPTSLHLGCLPDTVALPTLEDLPVEERTRSNAMLTLALAQIQPQVDAAIARHGPERVAVVLGASTAGLEEGLQAARQFQAQGRFPNHYHYGQQEMGNAAAFLRRSLGLRGPAHVISTACSSGAKALASGARLLQAGLADAVIAGGVDALSAFTIAGFSALESVSAERCLPLSANRTGINLGEGAALFLMSREPAASPGEGVCLSGWGETSDAHHMSAPEPSGRGAAEAMRLAMARARLTPGEVDYVNLHGTATPQNDAMESRAILDVLGSDVPVSSTKPLTGHTLAAAGAIEAALAWITLADNPQGRLPPHVWDGAWDDTLPRLTLARASAPALGRPVHHVLSNSFAFGGSNATLILSRT
ncbi:3-oxoacyl-ACP synthase [Hylemonella gracilis str. Niagara R]|uniref:3-oxoacyl-ACP synthase n=1 Tax=Hylemonella gracilis str. Niagara R TaxID=1458275 RepID=A0A016XGE2_9BURK|nr:beta-ketoacyl-ACP synthase [Hylemonella gracilis]EYC51154.1 3-oxoacyl-ACP synthase [Hylemonella gracilis str. Niagara R]